MTFRTGANKTSESVKKLLWRWVVYTEGKALLPLTRYEDGMIVVMPNAGSQYKARILDE